MYSRGGRAVSEAGSVDFRAASTCSSSWVSFGPFSRATWSNSVRSALAQSSSGTGFASGVACGLWVRLAVGIQQAEARPDRLAASPALAVRGDLHQPIERQRRGAGDDRDV